jgi:formylglycine-generating enzyme required for sulfatase activity
MASIEKTVFISYRRKDISWALAVYQYLTSQNYDVFFDYTSIPSGDFEQIIVGNIRARAHFVLILTPTALDRTSNKGDWLRREIETAIDERRNIVPLFFEGFDFNSPSVLEKLTGSIKNLNRYNGFEVPAGFFLEAMERMRTKYLTVPLDAIIHPVPIDVQKKVQEEQVAANKALVEQKKTVWEIIQPVRTPNRSFIGVIVGILILAVLGLYSVTSFLQNRNQRENVTPDSSTVGTVPAQTGSASSNPDTINIAIPSPTPIPTLGVGSVRFSEKDGMAMVYIPAGEFEMGNADGDEDEKPVHTVFLDAYWIDQTEVTNAMYAKCVEDGVCEFPIDTKSDTLMNYFSDPDFQNYPVINIALIMAESYCFWADRRLPTEAEWEKAATWDEIEQRKDPYPWSTDMDCSMANYKDSEFGSCVGDTMPVGSYINSGNAYGIFDMIGNVWEWTADWYDENYYANSPYENPKGPENGTLKVMRGGSFINDETVVSPTHRGQNIPSLAPFSAGIRCVMSE